MRLDIFHFLESWEGKYFVVRKCTWELPIQSRFGWLNKNFFWYLLIVQNIQVLYLKYANHIWNLASHFPLSLGISVSPGEPGRTTLGLREAELCPWMCICRWSPWSHCLQEIIENLNKLDIEPPARVLQAQICLRGQISSRSALVFLFSWPVVSLCLPCYLPTLRMFVLSFPCLPATLLHLKTFLFSPLYLLFEKLREIFASLWKAKIFVWTSEDLCSFDIGSEKLIKIKPI